MKSNDEIRTEREKDERNSLFELMKSLGEKYELKGMKFLSEEEKTKKLEYKLSSLMRNKEWNEAVDIANILPEPGRTEKLKTIFRLTKTDALLFHITKKVSKLLKYRLKPEEIRDVLNDCVENHTQWIIASEITSLLPKEERDEWAKENSKRLWEKFYLCLERGNFFTDAMDIINLFHESEKTRGLNKLLDIAICRGCLDIALNTVKLLDRTLTSKELEEMLLVCTKGEYLRDTKQIIGLLDRPLTPDEQLRVLLMENPKDWKLADHLPEPERTEKLKKIFVALMGNKETEEAKKVADILL